MKTNNYNTIKKLLFTTLWVTSVSVQAVPMLQVSSPAGSGDSGIYADHRNNSGQPSGVFGSNTPAPGGQSGGLDHAGVNSALTTFNGHKATAVDSAAEGHGATAFLLIMAGIMGWAGYTLKHRQEALEA